MTLYGRSPWRWIFLWAACLCVPVVQAGAPEARVFQFTYTIAAQDFPPSEAVDIYIPMPSQDAGQRILVQALQSSVPAEIGRETVYGNAYYRLRRPAGFQPLEPTHAGNDERDAEDEIGAVLVPQLGELLAAQLLVDLAKQRVAVVNHARSVLHLHHRA